MNRDEGQYHLSHIYDELLLNEKSPIRKSNGNSKTSAKKNSDRQDELSVIQVLIKETGVSETSTTLKWVVILFGSENMKHIYWYLSTDPNEPIQPFYPVFDT